MEGYAEPAAHAARPERTAKRRELTHRRRRPPSRGSHLGTRVSPIAQELYEASKGGNTEEAKRLIEIKAPVDWQDEYGTTPLWTASFYDKTDTARLLIESKAAVDKAQKDGDTPLIIAAYFNQMTTVRLLVESGADTTIRGDENKTAAEWAEQRGHHPVTEYLVNDAPRIRFQPSARNERGELYNVQGRAPRAATRDLVDIAGFDRDMMGLLDQFCTGKR